MYVDVYFFFFSSRRRHTRCSRDWSSDVCSSDLVAYRGEETSLRLVCGFLTTQRVEQAGHELADEERQQNHAHHQTDAKRAVLDPVSVERKNQGEANDAESQRSLQIGPAIAETVTENDQ